jgi:hypothetical protein
MQAFGFIGGLKHAGVNYENAKMPSKPIGVSPTILEPFSKRLTKALDLFYFLI